MARHFIVKSPCKTSVAGEAERAWLAARPRGPESPLPYIPVQNDMERRPMTRESLARDLLGSIPLRPTPFHPSLVLP